MNRKLKIIFSMIISLFFIYFSMGKINKSDIKLILLDANPLYIFIIFILELSLIEVSAYRWRFILNFYDVILKKKMIYRIFYKSLFYGTFMPGTLGIDSAKVYLMKINNVPISTSILTIIVDKLFVLYGLFFVSTISFFILKSKNLPFELNFLFGIIFPLAIVMGLIFFLSTRLFCKKLKKSNLFFKLNLIISKINFSFFFSSFFYSVFSALNYSLQFYFAYKAFGFCGNFFIFALLTPAIIILQSIPISFLGLGLREYSAIYLFGLFGAQANVSFSASCTFLFVSLSSIFLGFILTLFFYENA